MGVHTKRELNLAPSASGLDGIVVAGTALSHVDGARGELIIHGHSVEALAERATFEAACALIWNRRWPSPGEIEETREVFARARHDAFAMLPSLGDALSADNGMDAVRAAVSHISSRDPVSDRVRVTAAIAVFAAAWARRQSNQPPIPPRSHLSHAADVLQMLTGTAPTPMLVSGLDAYLCCVIDHGLNASTFTARVVTSTGADTISAVVAALGALKGPLHGGAPGPVLDMLDAVAERGDARQWLQDELAAGRRIMGMGHRVYHQRDPRASVLERAVRSLEKAGIPAKRLRIARAVEREAEQLLAERYPRRHLRANVEFYTAVLLDALGIPRQLFAPMFAASRVAGWCAHIDEQRAVGRLIRPESTYVGPWPAVA